jgi:hypothetical protein
VTIAERDSAARVEIVVDPVHFCSSADRARQGSAFNDQAANAGWHEPCSNSTATSQDFGENE